jgi:hypothetical protein
MLPGGAWEDSTPARPCHGESTTLMLAEPEEGITASGRPAVRLSSQHMQEREDAQRSPGSVRFGLIIAPVAPGVLQSKQLLHPGQPGDGPRGFLYIGIIFEPADGSADGSNGNFHECPAADRGILLLQQPRKRISSQTQTIGDLPPAQTEVFQTRDFVNFSQGQFLSRHGLLPIGPGKPGMHGLI